MRWAALTVLLALSSAAGASASPHPEECRGGAFTNICATEGTSSTLVPLSGEGKVEMHGSGAELRAAHTPVGEIAIVCHEDEVNPLGGVILQPSPSTADGTMLNTIYLERCALGGALGERCQMPTGLDTDALAGTWRLDASGSIMYRPVVGELTYFFKLEIRNMPGERCPAPVIGVRYVDGEQPFLLENAQQPLQAHVLRTVPAHKLRVFESPASFSTALSFRIPGKSLWALSREA
ncbi:MAG TPA: hypothetical protein VL979_15240 [Solirubrobacteraceae bacterium]|nr:hypothetical protein [Solirubrobacteraceae bacterium]